MKPLETVLIEAMKMCRENTVKNFGIAQNIYTIDTGGENANIASIANQTTTQIDVDNQETILQHIYKHFPEVAISVEEKTNDPTDVQKKLYKNMKSELLVQFDPIDGTYCYKNGLRNDYGLIASIVKKEYGQRGQIVCAIIYYPSLDMYIFANEDGVFQIKERVKTKICKPKKQFTQEKYHCAFTHSNQRLQLNSNSEIVIPDIYSITQMVLQIIDHDIPGFVTSNGQLADHIVGAWVTQRYGCDVEYASGENFGLIHYGDLINSDGKRTTPKDDKGLLIIGTKGDKEFEEIVKLHNKN